MNITNLSRTPEHTQIVKDLIHKSFEYKEGFSADIDFAPLFNKENFENLWFIHDDNEVLAHIGVLPKTLTSNGAETPVLFMGLICTSEKARGKGLFRKLMEHIKSQYKEYSLYLLWSDNPELYEKFAFYPSFPIHEYAVNKSSDFSFLKTKFHELSVEGKEQIKKLYLESGSSIQRSERDWKAISRVSSADWFYKKENGVISKYYVMNKGMDLTGIIHETNVNSLKELEVSSDCLLWTEKELSENRSSFYGTLTHINSYNEFKSFISMLTNNKVEIVGIEDRVTFVLGGTEHSVSQLDFLQGFFGPNYFEELEEEGVALSRIYIPGLDSI